MSEKISLDSSGISLLDYKDSETNRHIEYNSLYLRYSIKA